MVFKIMHEISTTVVYNNVNARFILSSNTDISTICTISLREKCRNTEFFLVRIFPHLDWIRRDTPYLSVFSPNAGKFGPEKLHILILFTQCIFILCNIFMHSYISVMFWIFFWNFWNYETPSLTLNSIL